MEPKIEPTCLTEEETLKQEQEDQIQQLSLQLQEQLEQQAAHGLSIPDAISTEMDLVLDSKENQNFLNAF